MTKSIRNKYSVPTFEGTVWVDETVIGKRKYHCGKRQRKDFGEEAFKTFIKERQEFSHEHLFEDLIRPQRFPSSVTFQNRPFDDVISCVFDKIKFCFDVYYLSLHICFWSTSFWPSTVGVCNSTADWCVFFLCLEITVVKMWRSGNKRATCV